MKSGVIIAIIVAIIGIFGYAFASGIFEFNLPNSIQSISNTNREPVKVYDYCNSFIRIDLKFIETECSYQKSSFGSWGGYDEKFKFHLPFVIEQGFPNSRAVFNQESKLYQYEDNDFELGLFDQVGEKRYHVKLWELP